MKRIYIVLYLLMVLVSCKEDDISSSLKTDDVAPGQLKKVDIENIPGGAKIRYELPDDKDILFVEANYKLADGIAKNVKSSFNSKELLVEGFSEIKEYNVQLYVVDKSGNKSAVTQATIAPLTPPIQLIESSLVMQPDFGGVKFNWSNELKTPVALLIYGKNNKDEEILIDTYYSDAKEGGFVLRGQESVERNFTVVIRDKWNNLSGRITKLLKPIFETKLDPTKFADLGTSFRQNVQSSSITAHWDGKKEDNALGEAVIPWNVSFSLGTEAKISRIKIWQYSWSFNNYGHYYAGGNARIINIYGSLNPNPSGALDGSWTLLKTCEIIKQSGLPIGIGRTMMSDEDFDMAKNRGHEFIVPLEAQNVKYIRIEVIKGWETTLGAFSELELFGAPIN
ncbi:DUF4959 domain-containing protein [Pedobacter nyackensis]|uniref:DUF4959 domain-containing protein n=1 Tax=Pedobacter nyackensis TaxID=475255 RepID=UPI00292E1799|nr:DUF4959 domain-containing protein [Pedobacter nyackensis]